MRAVSVTEYVNTVWPVISDCWPLVIGHRVDAGSVDAILDVYGNSHAVPPISF